MGKLIWAVGLLILFAVRKVIEARTDKIIDDFVQDTRKEMEKK